MSSIVYNMDCMEGMKQYPDNYFDLAIVDPPYGAGLGEGDGGKGWFAKYWDSENLEVSGGGHQILEQVRSEVRPIQTKSAGTDSMANNTVRVHYQGANTKRNGKWVFPKWKEHENKKIISWDVPPKQEYFEELFRISRNQVIWGGELFSVTTYKMFPDMAENECA